MIIVVTTDPARLPESVKQEAHIIIDASPGQPARVIASRYEDVELPDAGTIQVNNVSIVSGGPFSFSAEAKADEQPEPTAFLDFLDTLNF